MPAVRVAARTPRREVRRSEHVEAGLGIRVAVGTVLHCLLVRSHRVTAETIAPVLHEREVWHAPVALLAGVGDEAADAGRGAVSLRRPGAGCRQGAVRVARRGVQRDRARPRPSGGPSCSRSLLGAIGDGHGDPSARLLRLRVPDDTSARGTFVNKGAMILDVGRVTIGDRRADRPERAVAHAVASDGRRRRGAPGWESQRPVTIADGVWLGGGVIVCAGVTIGEDAVIGAGSVVTRDVPPRVFAAGNPVPGRPRPHRLSTRDAAREQPSDEPGRERLMTTKRSRLVGGGGRHDPAGVGCVVPRRAGSREPPVGRRRGLGPDGEPVAALDGLPRRAHRRAVAAQRGAPRRARRPAGSSRPPAPTRPTCSAGSRTTAG